MDELDSKIIQLMMHNKNKIKQINLVGHYKTENSFIFCAYAELF